MTIKGLADWGLDASQLRDIARFQNTYCEVPTDQYIAQRAGDLASRATCAVAQGAKEEGVIRRPDNGCEGGKTCRACESGQRRR